MQPTPRELFSRFERGEIDRDELHAGLAIHARSIIAEIEEDYRNPAAAWWEGMLARRAIARLTRRHGAKLIREVLVALADGDFPAAPLLWNAEHPDVPLHCFLRIKRNPVFRILSVHAEGRRIEVVMETGTDPLRPVKRRMVLHRDSGWKLRIDSDAPT